jgi:hypothetical protein
LDTSSFFQDLFLKSKNLVKMRICSACSIAFSEILKTVIFGYPLLDLAGAKLDYD